MVKAKDRRPSSDVVLVPDPDHCVEAAARAAYRRCVAACLRSASLDPALATRLETLRRFLERADFRRLRRESESLTAAGRAVRFVLRLEGERVTWRMEEEESSPEERP